MIDMSTSDRKNISDVRERLARLEERIISIQAVLEKNTSELAEWSSKVSGRIESLERLKSYALGFIAFASLALSFTYEWVKAKFWGVQP
jgi:hypothetical protein